MGISSRVRKIYEKHPYPPPALRGAREKWPLPALEWIDAVRESREPFVPKRVLVAGCGVGTEAFAIAERLPEADVVGVDFSTRSIATAKKLRRDKPGGERIRFEVADLSRADLPGIVRDRFDLISCHGVLSYIPNTAAVLRNFNRTLAPAGVVVLGVNGADHPNLRFRRVLRHFGVDVDEFDDGEEVRDVLRVGDSLMVYPPIPMAHREAGYLAGDIFGPLNRSLSLEEWVSLSREAGLHLLDTFHAFFATRTLVNRDLHASVMPRTRADVSMLVDAMQPMSFHQIVLTRRRPPKTPWMDSRELLRRRPKVTSIYKFAVRGGGPWHNLRSLKLASEPTNTSVELRLPNWELRVLHESDGERTLGEILRPVTPAVPAKTLREAMYLLYLLGVINLL